jgi:hypothetical protein
MKCPICYGDAHDIGSKDFDGRVFRCVASCKDFAISGTMLLKFLAKTREERADALERAVRIAGVGIRPCIDSRCL